MKKPTALQAVILASTAGVAGRMGHQLATHDVSVMATVSAVLAVLSTGLFIASRVAYVGRTVFYACPVKGCDVSISARDVRTAQHDRLRVLATDHSKHSGSA
uniref:Uncharacterized protein n=1 Tax=Streptomyces sp. F2 TaxID=317660 RepID=V9QGG1_9ACTN|nr:hypothetical protein pFP3.36 [Streptomyces sp. F2]